MTEIRLFLALCAALTLQAASLRPTELKCDFRTKPLGIDDRAPRLSWILEATSPTARGLRQSAYQIVAASSETALQTGQGDLWNTGKVASADTLHVVWAGKPLTSRTPVFWKVRAWDQDGKPSAWSPVARWTMGLLEAADWQGQWIGLDQTAPYHNPASPYIHLKDARWLWPQSGSTLESHFTLPAEPILRAYAVSASAGRAELSINGHKFRAGNLLPAADISAVIHPGDNTVAVNLFPARKGPDGWIAALCIEFTNREPLIVRTGANWPAARDLGPYGMEPFGDPGLREDHALPARQLRKEFTLATKPVRATAYLSGLGLSELYLNGARIGNQVLSPNLTEYGKRAFYVTHDVTAQLRAGKNAVGLWLGNGRFYEPRPGTGYGSPKALLQLDVEFADGTATHIVTDPTWRLSTDGPIRANNEFDGEEFDARLHQAAWSQPGFDDAKWQPAHPVSAPGGILAAQMAEPLQVTETLHPVKVTRRRSGVYLFDMGQNMVGWCRLHVSGKAGTRVILRHAETLAPDGGLYIDNLRSARATDTYTLSGRGPEVWEPRFTYHGFRYVEVIGYPGTPTLAALEGRVVHDALARTGTFESSNAVLNRIHRNMVWGFRGNYRSIPTDCPQRDERQGWLGDRSLDALSEAYLFDIPAFYEKWMQDIADSQRDSGSIPDVAPSYWKVYTDDVTWPATFFLVHQMLYEHYGDRRALERNYPAMQRWLAYMVATYQKDGLMPRDQYGDWCMPPERPDLIHSQDPARKTPGDFLGSAYFQHLLSLMSRFATILGKPADAQGYAAQAEAMRLAFERHYYQEQLGHYANGTQTSSVLPLAFRITPEANRSSVLNHLLGKIENETKGHIGVGLLGAQWLVRLLSETGNTDVAFHMATLETFPSWGYMAKRDATTIWELWNGDTADPGMNSGNHLMLVGDLGAWMYGYLGGIRPDPARPAYEHILIRPYLPKDLSSARTTLRSPRGLIATRWTKSGAALSLEVTIPPNTEATVLLPAGTATESGTAVGSARGVRLLGTENGQTRLAVGSGQYRFAVHAR